MAFRFNLRIIVTGVCSFVTDQSLGTSKELSIVLLDAWDIKKKSSFKSIDDLEEIDRHGAMLQIPSGNVEGLDGGGKLIWYPKRHQLIFDFKEETPGTNKYEVETSVPNHIADMTKIASRFPNVGTDVLSTRPPQEVLANVLFRTATQTGTRFLGGKLSVNKGPFNWQFSDALSSSVENVTEMAFVIHWDFKELEEVMIKATPFANTFNSRPGNPGKEGSTANFKIIGTKQNEDVEIIIANACDENPLIWQAADADTVPTPDDPDFKWHYEILFAQKAAVKRELGSKPLPHPIKLPILGNGRNCFPAFWVV